MELQNPAVDMAYQPYMIVWTQALTETKNPTALFPEYSPDISKYACVPIRQQMMVPLVKVQRTAASENQHRVPKLGDLREGEYESRVECDIGVQGGSGRVRRVR